MKKTKLKAGDRVRVLASIQELLTVAIPEADAVILSGAICRVRHVAPTIHACVTHPRLRFDSGTGWYVGVSQLKRLSPTKKKAKGGTRG